MLRIGSHKANEIQSIPQSVCTLARKYLVYCLWSFRGIIKAPTQIPPGLPMCLRAQCTVDNVMKILVSLTTLADFC